MMFTAHILQSHKSRTAFLLHGLHTHAGFWLPALKILSDFRIVLINVDYDDFFLVPDGVDRLDNFIRNIKFFSEENSIVIGHSFGSVLSAISKINFSRRYYLAPVFMAQPRNQEAFGIEISNRKGQGSMHAKEYSKKSRDVFSNLVNIDLRVLINRGDFFLIPDADLYFEYADLSNDAKSIRYEGDHFSINLLPIASFL